jgi:hypothetical protein
VSAFPSATEEKKIKLTLGQKNPRLAQGSYKRHWAAARRAASHPHRAAARVSNIGLTYTSLPNASLSAPIPRAFTSSSGAKSVQQIKSMVE